MHDNKKIINEELDNAFREVNVGAWSLSSDYEPHRKISFNYFSLPQGSYLQQNDEFFIELGKKIHNIITGKVQA